MKRKFYFGQRVPKSQNNTYGWVSDISTSEIATDTPIIICLPGNGLNTAKGANGFCKRAEKLLGLENAPHRDQICKIYCLQYGDASDTRQIVDVGSVEQSYFEAKCHQKAFDETTLSAINKENIGLIEGFADDLVQGLFKKMVEDKDGNLRPFSAIQKDFRKVSFLSFCYGSVIQLAINLRLHEYLSSKGLSPEAIKNLESQICVLQAAPICENSPTAQTTKNFINLSDLDTRKCPINIRSMQRFLAMPPEEQMTTFGGVYRETPSDVIFVGEAHSDSSQIGVQHESEFYLSFEEDWADDIPAETREGGCLPISLASCLRFSVQNAIKNSQSSTFAPLDSEKMTDQCQVITDKANKNPQIKAQDCLEEISLSAPREL